jgi:hypothetical protein
MVCTAVDMLMHTAPTNIESSTIWMASNVAKKKKLTTPASWPGVHVVLHHVESLSYTFIVYALQPQKLTYMTAIQLSPVATLYKLESAISKFAKWNGSFALKK